MLPALTYAAERQGGVILLAAGARVFPEVQLREWAAPADSSSEVLGNRLWSQDAGRSGRLFRSKAKHKRVNLPIKTGGESFILPYAIFPGTSTQVALMIPCYVGPRSEQ